ncbi:unnamed protein product [Taenia asiatica]|uniref:Rhodanese domain-containing protein n=1 Tax=Taenia asiatica TaxID=60517 RepID=A0A0R3VWW1_TAEAS|nr:unnamed protein product [Taenia asiatica]
MLQPVQHQELEGGRSATELEEHLYRFSGGDVSFNPNIDVKTYVAICEEPKGGQIFDVRDSEELDVDGRFPGAVNIPLGEVDSAFTLSEAEFKTRYGVPKPKVTDDNIIFVCKVGKRSLAACKSVEKYGYKSHLLVNMPRQLPKTGWRREDKIHYKTEFKLMSEMDASESRHQIYHPQHMQFFHLNKAYHAAVTN